MTKTWQATETIEIDAPPEAVWRIVTDVGRHPQLAGSGEVKAIRTNGRLSVGTTWEADEKVMGQSFQAMSRCIELEPARAFGWQSFPPPMRKGRPDSAPEVTWRFDLSPARAGTLVEHSFRVAAPASGAGLFRALYAVTRRPRTIRRGMRGTLRNLKTAAEEG